MYKNKIDRIRKKLKIERPTKYLICSIRCGKAAREDLIAKQSPNRYAFPTSMRFLLILCLVFVLGACSSSGGGSELVVSGDVLFKAKQCYTCHSIGNGARTGPDLHGLFQRRTEAWVREYLNDPIRMTAEDPTARALKERYQVQMPRLNLSPAELDQLVIYLKEKTRETSL